MMNHDQPTLIEVSFLIKDYFFVNLKSAMQGSRIPLHHQNFGQIVILLTKGKRFAGFNIIALSKILKKN